MDEEMITLHAFPFVFAHIYLENGDDLFFFSF
jgi:hypothetical protein